MARPKHRITPGATYFVTANTWQRRALLRNPEAAQLVVRKLFEYRDRGEYLVHAFVVMPDHIHAILTPGMSASLERAMQLIKGGSSHALHRRFPVWHPGFTEHQIRDRTDFESHVAYIHSNPVKAGLAATESDYVFSSLHSPGPLDPWPVTSGAKAPSEADAATAGLKPRPSAAMAGLKPRPSGRTRRRNP